LAWNFSTDIHCQFASLNYQFFNLSSALEYLVDSQGVRGMLPLLRIALAREVPEVTQLLARGDATEAAARLHSLKGFLPIFCYPPLVVELVHIEKCCRAGPHPDLSVAYQSLALQLQGLSQEIDHYEAQCD